MAGCNSVFTPNIHQILPCNTMATKFLVGISSSDAIFKPPKSAQISVSFSSSITRKSEHDVHKDNVVVPVKLEEQTVAAFTILMFSENHFKLKKVLKQSDVDGSSRLLLPKNWVEKYILTFIDPLEAQLCRTIEGKQFRVLDVDDDSLHHLVLKKWKNSYFVLAGNWIPSFVKRKHLEAGDLVGIAFFNGLMFFKLLKKKDHILLNLLLINSVSSVE